MSVRFAPSPTGRLHLGNLRTAWVSHHWARALGRAWHVRFEDIDRPRVVPGSLEQQLADLASLGLRPDSIVVQSARLERHRELAHRAFAEGAIYPCTCSRAAVARNLAGAASAPHGPTTVYSGSCRRARPTEPTGPIAWRFLMADETGVEDFLIGRSLPSVGDALADFQPAYHWACAIDDHDGGHSLLVRAVDLEGSARPQRAIMAWLSRGQVVPPAIYHAALVGRDDGGRLEKRTKGVTLGEIGFPPAEIARRMERSYRDFPRDLAPGALASEEPRTILAGELLGP